PPAARRRCEPTCGPTRSSPRLAAVPSPPDPGLACRLCVVAASAPRAERETASTGLVVQILQQLVRGRQDAPVPPLGRPIQAGDPTHPVPPPVIPDDEGIPRLGVVRGPVGEAEVPAGVLVERVRLQVRVLLAGRRLD